jgi:hypothetical protein
LLLKHSVVEVFLDIVRHLFDRNWLHVLFVLSLLLLKHLPNLPLTDRLLLFLVASIEPIRNRYGHIEFFPRLKIIGVSDLFELVLLSLLLFLANDLIELFVARSGVIVFAILFNFKLLLSLYQSNLSLKVLYVDPIFHRFRPASVGHKVQDFFDVKVGFSFSIHSHQSLFNVFFLHIAISLCPNPHSLDFFIARVFA